MLFRRRKMRKEDIAIRQARREREQSERRREQAEKLVDELNAIKRDNNFADAIIATILRGHKT